MVIERKEQQLGTADNPDVIPLGNEVEIIPEPTRAEEIRNAAEILINEEEILIDPREDVTPPTFEF